MFKKLIYNYKLKRFVAKYRALGEYRVIRHQGLFYIENRSGDYPAQVCRESANAWRYRHLVVVKHDDDIEPGVTGIVECFERHAGG